ncbi:MAG: sulfopyruvate decarboxylase subunit beta [Deltaproteobacteria bacterium]|nr:sulfopyruvate decarboxylase subunit beta [Deltaproteobacteria bacterium]
MTHFEAVQIIARQLTNQIVVSTVGNTNRELYSTKKHNLTLYGVQMSLVTPLALGLAKGIPSRKVIALDGDGSLLMGLGILTTVATNPADNLLIIVLDNGCYAACGWYPTAAGKGTDLAGIASSAGIPEVSTVENPDELSAVLEGYLKKKGPAFIRAKVESAPLREAFEPLPFDALDGTYRFRQALADEGLVEAWHDVTPVHYTFSK